LAQYKDWPEDISTIEMTEYKKRRATQVKMEASEELHMEIARINMEGRPDPDDREIDREVYLSLNYE
jgi:hypothetical protein